MTNKCDLIPKREICKGGVCRDRGDGSIYCECRDGFEYNADNNQCQGKVLYAMKPNLTGIL